LYTPTVSDIVLAISEEVPVKTLCGVMALTLMCAVAPAVGRAQGTPENSSSEWQVWTGGGHGINGSQSGTGVWNLGLRYGLLLTAPWGPGFMRGQFEYAFDVVPVWVIAQKTDTVYGASIDPFAFKWILSAPKKVRPFFEIEGGALFTAREVPENTSNINFTTSGGIGALFLREKHTFTVEVRFQHISNAGMTNPNPGINTMQVRIGFGAFRK
jgi:lipid A 3-O-deacylase